MEPHIRYQIIETIAQGDYATVFRAKDNELGREVAIKQIHQQYLADPKQLDRYWQEAQFLASLEHPYIMTIYDIVRERGWLILELMQGSLQQKLDGNPIDLEDLRLTLTYILHALHFLHQNNIIHGDVKPGNLLLDKNHRVKLGDFGIARRMAGDDGSVVKGTTKYMAPEVVSDQFGPVGPPSDIYSLGFSAYELMAGSHFDTLFPGLNMFGRDQQIAWMMWHSAVDRRLPEISRVLQGVPEDLAHVIEKMIEKDPAQRYKNAEKAILELRAGGEGGEEALTDEEKVAAEQVEKQAKRKRVLIIGAFAASMLMSLGLLFGERLLSSGPDPDAQEQVQGPSQGKLVSLYPDRNLIEIELADGTSVGIEVDPETDRFLVNDLKVTMLDLKPGDRLTIRRLKTADGKEFRDIEASRQLSKGLTTTIVSIDQSRAVLTLSTRDSEGNPLEVYVPSTVEIILNGSSRIGKRDARVADLKASDRVAIEHAATEDGEVASSLVALRTVSDSGYLVSVNTSRKEITYRNGLDTTAETKTFPVSPNCEFLLNDLRVLDEGKVVTLSHLKAEDRITIDHDAEVLRVDAHREFTAVGAVESLEVPQRRMVVRLKNRTRPVEFTLAPNCEIKLGDSGAFVDLPRLQSGDSVVISHMSADLKNPEARAISVTLKKNAARWAIVIVHPTYDDNRLSALPHIGTDAEAMRDSLLTLYRMQPDHLLFLEGASRRTMEQEIPNFIARMAQARQLLVYYGGHAFLTEAGVPLLAPKEFNLSNMQAAGVPLRWLIAEVEKATATEKILLLDSCHSGKKDDLKIQPSAARLVSTLKGGPTKPVSSSVTVVTSCSDEEHGLNIDNKGIFASSFVSAVGGGADRDTDHHTTPDELFSYLLSKVSERSGEVGLRQTCFRFLPDANPPRLTKATIDAVDDMLGNLRASGFDSRITAEYQAGRRSQPKEPDVSIAYALVSLKLGRTTQSLSTFEAMRASHPKRLVPYHGLAWQYFQKRLYKKGLDDLALLVAAMPDPDPEKGYHAYEKHLLQLAGKMGSFAFQVDENGELADDVALLNANVTDRGEQARKIFMEGVAQSRETANQFDDRIDKAATNQERDELERKRKQLASYALFDYDRAADYIRSRLEE